MRVNEGAESQMLDTVNFPGDPRDIFYGADVFSGTMIKVIISEGYSGW